MARRAFSFPWRCRTRRTSRIERATFAVCKRLSFVSCRHSLRLVASLGTPRSEKIQCHHGSSAWDLQHQCERTRLTLGSFEIITGNKEVIHHRLFFKNTGPEPDLCVR